MNILSLCDGMSCGQIALSQLNIPIDNYYASQIKSIAIKVTKNNFPNTIFIGDVNKIFYKNGILFTEMGEYETQIDLVMFGSPCQTFSVAMKKELRIGLQDKKKSGLFLECYRILKEVNPKYFFVENVGSMKKEDEKALTSLLDVSPICIDAADFSPCHRKRLYWTNLSYKPLPKEKKTLNDILQTGYSPKENGRCLLVSDSRPLTTPIKMFYRWYAKRFSNLIFLSEEHYNQCKDYFDNNFDKTVSAKTIDNFELDTFIFNNLRYLSALEEERIQGVPEGYTNCLTEKEAKDVLGDGWQIDVIKDFFNSLTFIRDQI